MSGRKAMFICDCFSHIEELGGPARAKAKLLGAVGRKAKLKFLKTFPGIGPKYARNIMMGVS